MTQIPDYYSTQFNSKKDAFFVGGRRTKRKKIMSATFVRIFEGRERIKRDSWRGREAPPHPKI